MDAGVDPVEVMPETPDSNTEAHASKEFKGMVGVDMAAAYPGGATYVDTTAPSGCCLATAMADAEAVSWSIVSLELNEGP